MQGWRKWYYSNSTQKLKTTKLTLNITPKTITTDCSCDKHCQLSVDYSTDLKDAGSSNLASNRSFHKSRLKSLLVLVGFFGALEALFLIRTLYNHKGQIQRCSTRSSTCHRKLHYTTGARGPDIHIAFLTHDLSKGNSLAVSASSTFLVRCYLSIVFKEILLNPTLQFEWVLLNPTLQGHNFSYHS